MNRRPLAAALVGFGIAAFTVTGTASAHSNAVACVDQATSTWRITNDYPLSESFTSLEGPSGTVAAGNGSYTDVVYNGDTLTVTGTWTDGFVGTTVGSGDCSPEVIVTTTTEAPTTTTELVTTTTAQEATTSTTTTSSTSSPTTSTLAPSTTAPTVTTAPTSTQPSTTITPTTSSEPATSSSVASTSTTSEPPSTPSPTTSTPSTPPSPSSTTPECSDNPNTPTDECNPVCEPVTLEDGSNSCGSSLPATGAADIAWLIPAATFMLLCGATIIICGRRR